MARRSLYAVAAAATLALAACSEREPESTTGPQFAPGSTTNPCGFSNSLVSGYFPGSHQAFLLTLKQSMANAGQGTTNARTFGFEIMDSIGSLSRTATVNPSAGAELTVALIGCMFKDVTFTYPTDSISDFTAALDNAAGGAYYVRGGGVNGVDAEGRSETVLGRTKSLLGVETNLSGIDTSSASWTTMLSTNGLSEGRALIYGYSVPNPTLLYEWASIPSALTFSPTAVVSVCDNDLSATAMVHEEAVGILTYVNTDICNETQSLTLIERGWGPKALAARVGQMFAQAFVPTPLQATAVATGTGGKTSTIPKSKFGKKTVNSLGVTWKEDPGIPSTWNGTTELAARPASAYVSALIPNQPPEPVRFCAYLTGTNNNGTPTKLKTTLLSPRDPECTDPPGGNQEALSVVTTASASQSVADFGNVWVTKTGTITFTLTVLSGAAATKSITSQANVKPLKK